MDSARRSSRAARNSQPLQSTSHHSSTSSNSSGRAERATRSNNKTESPRKTTPAASLSSEPTDDTAAPNEGPILLRRNRGRTDERDKPSKTVEIELTHTVEEEGGDDGTVRCICGYEDYPGLPVLGNQESKHSIKEGIEGHILIEADPTDDLAGFYVQCDVCKVWQHGGCVGIMSEDSAPAEYFCESCHKDLHKIYTAPNGQRYSHYLPLYPESRMTSRAPSFSKDGTKSPRGSKSGRPNSALQSAKRRSTMNSRDAAYDEDEQLRRAIEASKGVTSGGSTDGGGGGIRRGKRSRSDSSEKPEATKRQRTASASPSPSRNPVQPASRPDAEEGANGRTGVKKIRGAAARNHKEKELREEKERAKHEAATKRKGRAERRRVDDSDPSEDIPLAVKAAANKAVEPAAHPPEPPPSSQATVTNSPPPNPLITSHKKGGRPPNARKARLGKNQYTKDKDPVDRDKKSPPRSQSRDVPPGEEKGRHNSPKGKVSKAKNNGGVKLSMVEMERRVERILGFITKTQVEMAGESMSYTTTTIGIVEVAQGVVNGKKGECEKTVDEGREEVFGEKMSSMEMMDTLTRNLVKWQQEFTAA